MFPSEGSFLTSLTLSSRDETLPCPAHSPGCRGLQGRLSLTVASVQGHRADRPGLELRLGCPEDWRPLHCATLSRWRVREAEGRELGTHRAPTVPEAEPPALLQLRAPWPRATSSPALYPAAPTSAPACSRRRPSRGPLSRGASEGPTCALSDQTRAEDGNLVPSVSPPIQLLPGPCEHSVELPELNLSEES